MRHASVAVVGAGDYIGAAIARRFAREGYRVFCGRRNGDKLAPLIADIEAAGGVCIGRSLDARNEDDITAFMREANDAAPLEAAIFNVGANVNFPVLETTERVFRKVWELACYAGFLTGRDTVLMWRSRPLPAWRWKKQGLPSPSGQRSSDSGRPASCGSISGATRA